GDVVIDFDRKTISYVADGQNQKVEAILQRPWSVSFADIKEISQSGTQFGTLKAGYKWAETWGSGAVINGGLAIPLPSNIQWVGMGFGELPARQTVREYAVQIARMVGLPAERVKLVDARGSRPGFSFREMFDTTMAA